MRINETSCSMHQPIDTVCLMEVILDGFSPHVLKTISVIPFRILRMLYEYYEGDLDEILDEYYSFDSRMYNADEFLDELDDL